MIRLVIVGVAVFLVSLAGTTGALVMKARKALPAAPADSVAHADSAKAPAAATPAHVADAQPLDSNGSSVRADSAKGAAHADSATHAGTDAGGRDSVGRSGETERSVLAARPVELPNVSLDGADRQVAFKQLARIFSNMKTTDAAKVLAYMSDEEVEGVIRQLGVRPAAGLLAALPKERAASLSRRLLSASKGPAK